MYPMKHDIGQYRLYTTKELAEICEITPAAISSRIRKGLTKEKIVNPDNTSIIFTTKYKIVNDNLTILEIGNKYKMPLQEIIARIKSGKKGIAIVSKSPYEIVNQDPESEEFKAKAKELSEQIIRSRNSMEKLRKNLSKSNKLDLSLIEIRIKNLNLNYSKDEIQEVAELQKNNASLYDIFSMIKNERNKQNKRYYQYHLLRKKLFSSGVRLNNLRQTQFARLWQEIKG